LNYSFKIEMIGNKIRNTIINLKYICLVLFLGANLTIDAQILAPTQLEFGQNRIQKKEYSWKVLISSNFEMYFYGDAQSIANNSLLYAESEFERLSALLGYSPYSRTKIFLYNSPSEMFQSNANLNLTGEINSIETNLSKSKIEVAFTGDATSFKKILINKISEIFVYEMLYGGSLKDALQSSILLTLPDWFISGISAYAANGWSNEMDDYMRDAVLKKRMKKPEKLAGKEATLFGQSIWNYIAERYGKDNISNILNLTRIIRNDQTSIGSTLGTSYNRFLKDWRDYYANMATPLTASYSSLRTDFRIVNDSKENNMKVVSAKLSPDQSIIAMVTNENGQFLIEIYAIKTKKKTKIMKIGQRSLSKNNINSPPLIAWAKGKGNILAAVFEKEGESRLQIFSEITTEKIKGKVTTKKVIKGFQQITEMDISEAGNALILSAEKKGQNDLFLYDISRGSVTQITNDPYDDRQPSFVGNSRSSVVYLSNRISDSVKVEKQNFKTISNNFGIFLHDGNPRAEVIRRLVDSVGVINRPIAINDSTVLFVSDEKGLKNIYKYTKGDTTYQKINQVTNSITNIEDFDSNINTGSTVYISNENGRPYIGYLRRLDYENEYELPALSRVSARTDVQNKLLPKLVDFPIDSKDSEIEKEKADENPSKMVLAPGEIDTDNYVFDTGSIIRPETRPTKTAKSGSSGVIIRSNNRKDSKIKGPSEFKDKFELINLDNTFVVDPIRGFGWKNTAVFSDVLQNQILKAGIMITPTLRNGDLFVDYGNYTKRIDFGARYDRRSFFDEQADNLGRKLLFNKISANASYPINNASRISFSPFVIATSTRFFNATTKNSNSNFTGWNLEYNFDNTSTLNLNNFEGTRLKVKYESVRGITRSSESFSRFGIDARNYKKLPKEIILATRLSYGRSLGNSPRQYILGGMDNWIGNKTEIRNVETNPLYNDNLAIDNRMALLFADFLTNMRGFNLNKATGSNHVVINAELRFPIFSYISSKQINSSFLKNFQATIFTDIGTVWNKRNPLQKKNDFNTRPIENSFPFSGQVTDFKSPILAGYGIGARTSILGYFVKLDTAWGIDDGETLKPITYLTFGYDF
jgi:hypothetical protein